MKILFVCKHNRFRSKIAEAAFKKFNKNKSIKVSSAGVFKGIPVSENVLKIGKEINLNINKKTSGLDEKKMKGTDLVVIVANDVPKSIFKNKTKKIIQWNISDVTQDNKEKIRFIAEQIVNKVKGLIEELK
ncbi:MAG: arsenate reductase ArsC [Nanoarchaeota archaeon]|nr:arsenate reductase ArsC [Nanoarchaeota archaeon]